MTDIVQCPQCGFLEYDEHSGCAVCGFHSRAALKTGHPALKPLDHKLIEFPLKNRVAGKPPSHHESALPEISLPLFDERGKSGGTPIATSELEWREELQEKLRQYRARRGGERKEQLHDPGMKETGQRVDPRCVSPSPNNDLAAALDEAFKLHPGVHPSGFEFEKEELKASSISAKPRASVGTPRPLVGAQRFELPESVQKIKQRHPPRRSELFQQPLLFEASAVQRGPMPGTDHAGLPVPVASARERFLAACVDLSVIAAVETISALPVLALLHAKGWSLNLAPRSVAIVLITLLIFALGYVLLFTATTGRTLGMNLRGLSLVNFSGESPSLEEAALRTVGYLVSAGSLLLGFAWVLFDVDSLAWHDRISRTYPTRTPVLARNP
ncbi:MAG: RDD family protein [Acidobacteriia bacterium]|nr:RDD family protein [Terriglobia bacterium]